MKRVLFTAIFCSLSINAMQVLEDISIDPIATTAAGIGAAGALVYYSEQGVLTPMRHGLTTLGLCALTGVMAASNNLDPYIQLSLTAGVGAAYALVRPYMRISRLKADQFQLVFNEGNREELDILSNAKPWMDLIDAYKRADEDKNERIDWAYKNMWQGSAKLPGVNKLFANEKAALVGLRRMHAKNLKIEAEKSRLKGFFTLEEDTLFEDRLTITPRLIALIEERQEGGLTF